jgi:thiamine-phosphate pyrophosphorylase
MSGPPAALPPLLLLTDRSQLPADRDLAGLVAAVEAAVGAGARAVVVRERDLEDHERAELVCEVRKVLAPVGGTLVVAAPTVGRPVGVHLRRSDPLPRTRPVLLGRSCHDANELARAAAEGCDYVTVSPVTSTASKPGHGPALGPDRFAELAQQTGDAHGRRPSVYALGGVTPDNAGDWLAAGADGVAVMGAVMRADDPGTVVGELLHALSVTA